MIICICVILFDGILLINDRRDNKDDRIIFSFSSINYSIRK